MRKLLGKLLFFAVLEMGALAGVPMSPEEIERRMEVMNRVEVVQVIPTQLRLSFDRRASKQVPVHPRVVGNFAAGFQI